MTRRILALLLLWPALALAGGSALVFNGKTGDACTTEVARKLTRNNHPIAKFEDGTTTTSECLCWESVLPSDYQGGGLTFRLYWMATSATTGNVVWTAAIERQDDDVTDLDSDSFATAQSVTATTASASGELAYDAITFTSGAQMDSLAASESFRVKVCRDADAGGDTMTGDAELARAKLHETGF